MSKIIVRQTARDVKGSEGKITGGVRSQARMYHERKERGQCPVCGKARTDEHVICRGCRMRASQERYEYFRRYRERRRDERKAKGLCVACGRENDTKLTLCTECLEKQRVSQKRWREKMRKDKGGLG